MKVLGLHTKKKERERKKKEVYISICTKQEAQSPRKDNALFWKSQINRFGRRHYSLRYMKDSTKTIKEQRIIGLQYEKITS